MTDLTKLLAAIQPDAPGGADLRRDSTTTLFARLRELRRRDDPATVAQGVEPKEADFQAVAEVCSEALATSTKDLELAAYLTEAWAATRGLAGLADGLALVKALLEGFWPHLQPGLERENGTVEIVAPVRAKWLGWLAGAHEFLTTVRSVELTDDGRSLLDYEAAQRMQEKQRVDLPTYEKMLAEGYVTPEQWAKSVAASGARLTGEIAAAQRCLDELGGLGGIELAQGLEGAVEAHGGRFARGGGRRKADGRCGSVGARPMLRAMKSPDPFRAQLVVDQLGAIEHAELTIRPLTLFFGPNGTNKTWTAYALYGLLRRFGT